MSSEHLPCHHGWPVRVYWEDTDAGGIVFYANYLKFFERARTEWLRALGFSQQALRENPDSNQNGLFVVSACDLTFLASAKLDDELLITTQIENIGGASVILRQSALLKTLNPSQNDTTLCSAKVTIVWTNNETRKPQKIPPPLLSILRMKH